MITYLKKAKLRWAISLFFCLSVLIESIAQTCINPDPSEQDYYDIPWYGDENAYTALDKKYDSLIAIYGSGGSTYRSVEDVTLRIPVKFYVYQNSSGTPGGTFAIPTEEGFQRTLDDVNNAFSQ